MSTQLRISVWTTVCLAGLVGCEPQGASLVSQAERSPWKTPDGGGLHLTTEHYDIFTTVEDRWMQSYFPGFMEAAYDQYLALTGLPDRPLRKRMPIYMMNSREQWAGLTRHRMKERADALLAIEAGGYTHQGVCVFWKLIGPNALAVASHEGLHQFLHYRLRHHLPMWLEEGLCTLAEGYHVEGQSVRFTPDRNLSRFTDLRSALANGKWIPLQRLVYMESSDAVVGTEAEPLLYYGQIWALARYLTSRPRYAGRVHRMLTDAEAGQFHKTLNMPPQALAQLQMRGRAYNQTVSEPLFRRYITEDLAGFERAYKAYAMILAELK